MMFVGGSVHPGPEVVDVGLTSQTRKELQSVSLAGEPIRVRINGVEDLGADMQYSCKPSTTNRLRRLLCLPINRRYKPKIKTRSVFGLKRYILLESIGLKLGLRVLISRFVGLGSSPLQSESLACLRFARGLDH